jgi:broad specificity phosphatase PhoE
VRASRLFVFVAVAAACIAPGLFAQPAIAQEAVFVVRHAERLDSSTDSPLSADGQARAARLAQMLRDARITTIVASEFKRTQDTARPLADLLKLPVQPIAATDLDGLLTKLRAAGPRGRVLVVSHSDRIPAILAALGDKQEVTVASSEYGNLWMVVPGDGKSPLVMRLRY